ncbi:MAG TPA: glycosyltransferase [Solirubrobacteraceae bacterium]|nr:glycosyltransferase [Solirubrobacteraceae bacterium]
MSGSAHTDLDIVIPVHDEQAALEASVRMLHGYLSRGFPFSWQITIVDSASTDGTLKVARRLMYELPEVGAMHLRANGRGLALRTAWTASGADVVAYMDADLSTDLNGLLPLVAPLVAGHSDLAIGTRLHRAARVTRSPKSELISRAYNRLLRTALRARFSDAGCGFKAIRAAAAHELIPLIQDDESFFDTELLVLAQRRGLRIHEVPVDWAQNRDSRFDIVPTALADLSGVARLLVHRPAGRRPALPAPRRPVLAP